MTSLVPEEIITQVSSLLHAMPVDVKNADCREVLSFEALKGDGSSRRFWRATIAGSFNGIVVAPEKYEERCLREAVSVWKIGSHLRSAGVPVPELYGFDDATGVLVCEDLGDTHLHGYACATDFSDERSVGSLRKMYRETLDVLVAMQFSGARGFDSGWCWDTPVYDRELMLERESGYFLRAFWQGLLVQQVPDGLLDEFMLLADVAAASPACFFLHRDFQSRNVMIKEQRVRIIDFQGGRLGPLQYDLASLLLDPYAGLPRWFQDEMYDYYLQLVQFEIEIDQKQFHRSYLALALQRNLQILGAFSYLSDVCGKEFFRQYIRPAIVSLVRLLRESKELDLPVLVSVAERAHKMLVG